MKKIIIIFMLFVPKYVDAHFFDSIFDAKQMPCNVKEYEQQNRQKISSQFISNNLKQLYEDGADYYFLGKLGTKDTFIFILESKSKEITHGYLCEYVKKTKALSFHEIIHREGDCMLKVFCLERQKISIFHIRKEDGLSTLITESYNFPNLFFPKTNTISDIPKSFCELKNTESKELDVQYVKEHVLQVQNCEYSNHLQLQYYWYGETPLKKGGCGIIEVNNGYEQSGYLCHYEHIGEYPRLLKIFEIKGQSPNMDYSVIGSNIQIVGVVDTGDRNFLRTEIYEQSVIGGFKRIYINPPYRKFKTLELEFKEELVD